MKQTSEQISQKTIPGLFLERAKDSPRDVAFRYKHLGIYKEVTWEQYWSEVEAFAFGLLDLGLEPGDRVAIMGDPCPEWIYADLAVLCARGIDYGVYTTSSIEEVEYLNETGRAKFFITENQKYVDKILSLRYLQETMYEVQPTFLHGVPRVWEKIAAQALVAIEQSSWVKKVAYRCAMGIGRAYLERKCEKHPLYVMK